MEDDDDGFNDERDDDWSAANQKENDISHNKGKHGRFNELATVIEESEPESTFANTK